MVRNNKIKNKVMKKMMDWLNHYHLNLYLNVLTN